MENVQMYLESVSGQLKRVGRTRESKVEKALVEVVEKLIEKNEATTIKRLSEITGKRPQHIHQVLKKSTLLKKTKIKGFTLVIPNKEETEPVSEEGLEE